MSHFHLNVSFSSQFQSTFSAKRTTQLIRNSEHYSQPCRRLLFPGLYGLILATGVNIVFVTLYDGLYTFHFLKEKNRVSPIDPLWMML